MVKVHYVNSNNGVEIAYFPQTKRFFKINNFARELIDSLVCENEKSDIMKKFNISEEELEKYYEYIENKNINCETECNSIKCEEKQLSRLVIHLTNKCNLRCMYCYASGGNYMEDEGILQSQDLNTIIERFYSEFDKILIVQFFGGEPLLNIPLLEEACSMIRKIDSERGYKTQFGLVTNGTILNDRIIDIIKKYEINITISYDGNQKINDITRVDINGHGTSEIILKNAKHLKEKTGQPSTIEVTYNQYHIENNVNISNVINHIQNELPDTSIHLVPAGGTEDDKFVINNLDVFPESVDSIFNSVESIKEGKKIPSYSLVDRILYGLSNKEYQGSPYVCDAGLGTLSVSIDGDVYPCFMFTNQETMRLGNVKDNDIFRSDHFKKVMNRLINFSIKSNNEECNNCFIKSLCNGCLGLNSFHSGDPFKLSPNICKMFRDMTDRVLIDYAELIEKEDKIMLGNES